MATNKTNNQQTTRVTRSRVLNNNYTPVLLTALGSSLVPSFAKIALEEIDTFTLVLIRFSSAALLLLAISKTKPSLNQWRDTLPVTVLGALNPLTLFVALENSPASIVPLLYALTPALTAGYFFAVGKHRISTKSTIGICLGLFGVLLILVGTQTTFEIASPLPFILIIAAVGFFTSFGIASNYKLASKDNNVTPESIAFYLCATTSLLALPLAGYETVQGTAFDQPTLKHLAAALTLGLFGTVLQQLFFQKAIHVSNATVASLFTYIQPLLGVLLAVLLLSEPLPLLTIGGGLMVLWGAYMAQQPTK